MAVTNNLTLIRRSNRDIRLGDSRNREPTQGPA
jgi:hypothetical protein